MKKFYILLSLMMAFSFEAKATDVYLFYNSESEYLKEIDIKTKEVKKIFMGEFGTVIEELPNEVKFEDFYVSRFPDKSYVFMLDAPFSCGQLGCSNVVFERDEDGKLYEIEKKEPLKCKRYDSDKLLCTTGGYKPDLEEKRNKRRKRKILRFPAPTSVK